MGAKQPLVAQVFDIRFLPRVVGVLARRRSADHCLRLGFFRSVMNEVPVPPLPIRGTPLSVSMSAARGCWPSPWPGSRAGGMHDPTRQAEWLMAIRLRYTINTHLED